MAWASAPAGTLSPVIQDRVGGGVALTTGWVLDQALQGLIQSTQKVDAPGQLRLDGAAGRHRPCSRRRHGQPGCPGSSALSGRHMRIPIPTSPAALYSVPISPRSFQIAVPLPKLKPPPLIVHLIGVYSEPLPDLQHGLRRKREALFSAERHAIGEHPPPGEVHRLLPVIGNLNVLVGLNPFHLAVIVDLRDLGCGGEYLAH